MNAGQHAFSNHNAQLAMEEMAKGWEEQTRDWLRRWEPELFAANGEAQVVDSALQALFAVHGGTRCVRDKGPTETAAALAHVAALMIHAQPKPKIMWDLWVSLVQKHLDEIRVDLKNAKPKGRG